MPPTQRVANSGKVRNEWVRQLRPGQTGVLGTVGGTAVMQQKQAFAAVCPAVPLSRAPRIEPADRVSMNPPQQQRSTAADARAFCTARSPPAARARDQAERG